MQSPGPRVTPIRNQYLRLKSRYPDAILFFRLGDFYETFDDDAKLIAKELEITLTGRDMGQGQRVPMAGVPYHAVQGYLARLVGRGYRVAICEQLTDTAHSKGLVERDVVRVVTPGTVVEPGMMVPTANNYLASTVRVGGAIGLAYADISTGEFAVTQLGGSDPDTILKQELARLEPVEVLVPPAPDGGGFVVAGIRVSPYEGWHFDLDTARRRLLEHFKVGTLEGYGCAHMPAAICSAGALLQYINDTQASALRMLQNLRTYSTAAFMQVDPSTRRNLEIIQSSREGGIRGSLLWVLNHTCTPMGSRLLRRWLNEPLLDANPLESRLNGVEAIVEDGVLRSRLIAVLAKVSDMERLIGRIVQKMASPRDLIALRHNLALVPTIIEIVSKTDEQNGVEPSSPLQLLSARLEPCPEICQLIDQAIVSEPPANCADGGVIADGFSDELGRLRKGSQGARQWIAGLERTERERAGIRSLKVGFNKVFGYYIEVSQANAGLVPEDYIRKQTLAGAERFITPELKEQEALVLSAQERIVSLEQTIFTQVCEQVAAEQAKIMVNAGALAEFDALQSLATVATLNRYVRPKLTEGDELTIIGGRHPVVETAIEEPFVPNDTALSCSGTQIMILTGPNMAGKSTYLRQVALLNYMAQVGSFVPAESAQIGLVDRIFSRVGAQDDIAAGQSTFMVEMSETANILHNATRRSLVILDEIGRGTSTYDGISIARAVVEY
jgi:DNA mismatch repair protein MutS